MYVQKGYVRQASLAAVNKVIQVADTEVFVLNKV